MDYKTHIEPLGVVAIRQGQHEVHAPKHDSWGEVPCESCKATFVIGPNRIYGFRGQQSDYFRQLKEMLAEDHTRSRQHQNAYELGG